MALGFFAVELFVVGQFAVKKKPNLTFFFYGKVSYGKKSGHGLGQWAVIGEREVDSPYAVLS